MYLLKKYIVAFFAFCYVRTYAMRKPLFRKIVRISKIKQYLVFYEFQQTLPSFILAAYVRT